MRRRPWLSGAILAVAAAACTPDLPSTTPPSTLESAPSVVHEGAPSSASLTPAPPVPAPVLSPVPARDLVDAAERAKPPGMTLGVAVLDVTTGELVEGGNGARRFMSASLSKLVVVVDMLDRRRTEGRPIAEPDLAMVARALSGSDDGAMNVLWGRYDGQGAIRRVATGLGLTATRPPADPTLWGDTMTSAADFARIYRHILNDMPPEDRAVIVDALAATTPTAADGFAQHYGLLGQGASAQLYAKQAWVPWAPAGHLLHSAGVAHDPRTSHAYAIALLSIQPSASAQTARDRLSAVATAALDALEAA